VVALAAAVELELLEVTCKQAELELQGKELMAAAADTMEATSSHLVVEAEAVDLGLQERLAKALVCTAEAREAVELTLL
jgi:hypothetical protein